MEGTPPVAQAGDMTSSGDDLGDRMKAYEAVETARTFDRMLPIYARIDGRSFSRLTRSMQRPFDPRLAATLVATAAHLIRETHARIGYTQSDEISLVWLVDAESEPLFGGKVHKWTSVLASLAAAAFQQELTRAFGGEAEKLTAMLPHFDARVLQLPSKIEAANAILWRTLDARKNAVSMAARAAFPAQALHGKDQAEMRAMMAAKGIDFDEYPRSFRQGTFQRRVTSERELTPEDIARIPAAHRPLPGTRVQRSEIVTIEMPDFVTVANRVEVIFDGAEPSTAGPR